jgi:hypothetical protein
MDAVQHSTCGGTMDAFERAWIDYVMPVLGIVIVLDSLFRQKIRDPTALLFLAILAFSSVLMGLNTLARLGLL